MTKYLNNTSNYTPIQLRLPLEINTIISFDDPVYTFAEVMKGLDLKKYFISEKTESRGRKGYNPETLLKVILFAFMIRGYASVREIEDLCKNDIRFIWLTQDELNSPSHMTISNFIKNQLTAKIADIFKEVNKYIFSKDNVDTNTVYIDGSKFEANANKYSWVWKKACIKNRDKLFVKISTLLENMNFLVLSYADVKFNLMSTYEIDYVEAILSSFISITNVDETTFVYGKGKRKSELQRICDTLNEYLTKLKDYAYKIDACGEHRNSFSKTDNDATFMRIKSDYMRNDQLLPAYNVQIGVCNEYIAVVDVNQFASDANCFVPLMNKFQSMYDMYPQFPVGDAGYGSYNNYLFCEENNMQKYMKFSMYNKQTKDKKYMDNPFRVDNFKRDLEGNLICPNEKRFLFSHNMNIKGNKYGRTQEVFACESCDDCDLKKDCHKSKDNRKVILNKELSFFHKEVIANLSTDHGITLRKNRSIQVEGAFGIIKQNLGYTRIRRKGLINVLSEITIISTAFNLYKYHNKKSRYIN